jgi:hypothetical protein
MPRGQQLHSAGGILLLIGVAATIAAAPLSTALADDANCDPQNGVADVPTVIGAMFGDPDVCPAADVNGDGGVTVADITGIALGLTPPPLPTATATSSPTPMLSPLPSETPTGDETPTSGATATAIGTATGTPISAGTPTTTGTPAATATATLPLTAGPIITFFGLTTADGHVLQPATSDTQGNPVDVIPEGSQFFIVVEAKAGTSRRPPGTTLKNSDPNDPSARPDLQIIANRDLGNGSTLVCDAGPGHPIGGVPGINPPTFDITSQQVADALNDFACRFADQTTAPCTLTASENYAFVAADTSTQFCSAFVVGLEMLFPSGDTLLTVQWRDAADNIGLPRRLVVRVQ